MLKLPRLYINGFPKAGLHLAELMVNTTWKPVNKKYNWYGTSAWHTEARNLETAPKLAVIQNGQYLKGHANYNEYLCEMLIGLEIGMVFVYRDLRDVAVSQAYHILSKNEELLHPARDFYPDDFDDVLTLVIAGLGEYDGLLERWRKFEPWLDTFWVFSVRYDELLKRPEKAAGRFFEYYYSLALQHAGIDGVKIDKAIKDKMVKAMVSRMKSHDTVTFRKGKTGQWRYEFKPQHIELFKRYDTDNALLRLGFEKEKDWH